MRKVMGIGGPQFATSFVVWRKLKLGAGPQFTLIWVELLQSPPSTVGVERKVL